MEHLTPNDCTATSWSVTVDGSQIVWHKAASTLLDDARMLPQEVYLMDSDGSNCRALPVPVPQSASGGQLSPDGTQLLFTMSATPTFGYSYTSTLFLTAIDSSSPAVPLPPLLNGSQTISSAQWSPSGDAILVNANCGVRHGLFKLDLASQTWSALTDLTADVSFGGWCVFEIHK